MNNFERLKQKFTNAQKRDVLIRANIRIALAGFNNYISEITLKSNLIILTAINKSAANELFLNLEEIKVKLPAGVSQIQVH